MLKMRKYLMKSCLSLTKEKIVEIINSNVRDVDSHDVESSAIVHQQYN